jgi:DNA-binding GntR family transcriptional regulator
MRITAEELDEIRALHYEMLACYARRDLPGYYRRNHAIHALINLAARNPVLTQTYRTINARIQALRFRSNFNREKWEAAVEEHEQMIEALAGRDGARMRAILTQHLAHKCEAVLADLAPRAEHGVASKA